MFGEKKSEYSGKQKREIEVWQSPKYKESREKAIELIESKKYGLTEADFWILMNETNSGKMGYTGLIISHAGCLKINDTLPQELRFDPESVTINDNGYGESLVFYYCNKTQGIFETGEVSAKNCKNAYPYAMAQKRLIDRVVLMNTKLKFAGIYGEDEADDFDPKEEPTEVQTEEPTEIIYVCADCKKEITPAKNKNGEVCDVETILDFSQRHYGRQLCSKCLLRLAQESNEHS